MEYTVTELKIMKTQLEEECVSAFNDANSYYLSKEERDQAWITRNKLNDAIDAINKEIRRKAFELANRLLLNL